MQLLRNLPGVVGGTDFVAREMREASVRLIRKAGYTKTTAQTGAVTLIQRFGGTLNLNIHFHMLFLDGVYIGSVHGSPARLCASFQVLGRWARSQAA